MVRELSEGYSQYARMTNQQLFNELAEFAHDADWMEYVDDSIHATDDMWDCFVDQTEQQFNEDEETRSLLYDSITNDGTGNYANDMNFLSVWSELVRRFPM